MSVIDRLLRRSPATSPDPPQRTEPPDDMFPVLWLACAVRQHLRRNGMPCADQLVLLDPEHEPHYGRQVFEILLGCNTLAQFELRSVQADCMAAMFGHEEASESQPQCHHCTAPVLFQVRNPSTGAKTRLYLPHEKLVPYWLLERFGKNGFPLCKSAHSQETLTAEINVLPPDLLPNTRDCARNLATCYSKTEGSQTPQ